VSAGSAADHPGAGSDEPDEPGGAVSGALPATGSGPCRINITVTPAGSNIRADGQNVGVSPISLDGPCAPRRLQISHPRYAPVTRSVTPVQDKPESLDVTLVRPTHYLTIVTTPPGANISIEGRRAGTSPTVVQITGFTTIKITIEKSGYKPVVQRL